MQVTHDTCQFQFAIFNHTARQCPIAKIERFTITSIPLLGFLATFYTLSVRLLQAARQVLWLVIRISHKINCSYHMQSHGERHSQYMHIWFFITMFTAHIVKRNCNCNVQAHIAKRICIITMIMPHIVKRNKEHTALYLKYI